MLCVNSQPKVLFDFQEMPAQMSLTHIDVFAVLKNALTLLQAHCAHSCFLLCSRVCSAARKPALHAAASVTKPRFHES